MFTNHSFISPLTEAFENVLYFFTTEASQKEKLLCLGIKYTIAT